MAPKKQAKDKHVARRIGARIINIIERVVWNDRHGVAGKNKEILAGIRKLTKEQGFSRH